MAKVRSWLPARVIITAFHQLPEYPMATIIVAAVNVIIRVLLMNVDNVPRHIANVLSRWINLFFSFTVMCQKDALSDVATA